MRSRGKLVVFVYVAAGVLTACKSSSGGGGRPAGASGIAVDPYIVGAVFQEQRPDGTVVQESSASGADGAFSFPKPLTSGDLVVMVVNGTHNAVPYGAQLKRSVDATDRSLVVSPLTTLVATGKMTAAQAVSLLNSKLGASFTEADLFADPMARLAAGNSAAAQQLLGASLAASVALEVLHGDVQSADFGAVVAAVGPKLLTTLGSSGSVEAVASAAAAVAHYAAQGATTPAEVSARADSVSTDLIAALVQAASSGQSAAIVDVGGILQAVGNSGSIADHLAKGTQALEAAIQTSSTDSFLEAVARFSAAGSLVGIDSGASRADEDRARFFGAVARVAALANPYSDSDPDNGLNNVGDFLDAYGVGGTAEQRKNVRTVLPSCSNWGHMYLLGVRLPRVDCTIGTLPSTSPRTAQVQAFLYNRVASSLSAAIAMLEGVSDGFTAQLHPNGGTVNFDSADALFVKGAAQAMLASIELQKSYDLDADLKQIQSEIKGRALVEATTGLSDPFTLGDFLAMNPSFLHLTDTATLPTVRAHLLDAVRTLRAAGRKLEAKTGDRSKDFIKISDEDCGYNPSTQLWSCTAVYNRADKLDRFDSELAKAETVLTTTGSQAVTIGGKTLTVNPDPFFAGVDLRAKIPTVYTAGAAGDRAGFFPDVTFGGALVQSPWDLNADADGDGSPDIFGGYTYFFNDYLASPYRGFYAYAWTDSYNYANFYSYQMAFDTTEHKFQVAGTSYGCSAGACGQAETTLTGSYTYDKNVLDLVFEANLLNVGRAHVVASALHDGWIDGQTTCFDSGGSAMQYCWVY